MNLGAVISEFRKKKDLKQGELATTLGISQTYLSQIEKNKKEPSLSLLREISNIVGVSLPLMFFLAIDSEDIPPSKKTFFEKIYPLTKDLIIENLLD